MFKRAKHFDFPKNSFGGHDRLKHIGHLLERYSLSRSRICHGPDNSKRAISDHFVRLLGLLLLSLCLLHLIWLLLLLLLLLHDRCLLQLLLMTSLRLAAVKKWRRGRRRIVRLTDCGWGRRGRGHITCVLLSVRVVQIGKFLLDHIRPVG